MARPAKGFNAYHHDQGNSIHPEIPERCPIEHTKGNEPFPGHGLRGIGLDPSGISSPIKQTLPKPKGRQRQT